MEILKHIYALFITLFIPLLAILQHPEVVVNLNHQASINCTDISPDGNWIVTGGADNVVMVSEYKSQRMFYQSKGFDFRVSRVKFAPSPKILGVAVEGGRVEFLNFMNGKTVSVFEFDYGSNYNDIDYCESFGEFVAVDGSEVVVGNYITGEELSRFTIKTDEKDDVGCLIWNYRINPGNRNQIYSVISKKDAKGGVVFELVIIDLKTKKIINRVSLEDETKLFRERGGVTNLKMDVGLENDYLIIGGDGNRNGFDSRIYVFDAKNLKFKYSKVTSGNRIESLIVLSIRDQFFIADDLGVRILDAKKGKQIYQALRPSLAVDGCLMSVDPSESFILIGGSLGEKYLFDLVKYEIKLVHSDISSVAATAYDQVGRYYATATDNNGVFIWDLMLNKIVSTFKGRTLVAFRPNTHEVFYISGLNVESRNIKTNKIINSYDPEGSFVQDIKVSLDGKTLIAATLLGEILVWDITTAKLLLKTTGEMSGWIKCAVHPNGKLVAVGGTSQKVYVFDIEKNQKITTLDMPMGIVNCMKFNDSGSLLGLGDYTDILLYSTTDWSLSKVLKGQENVVYSLDFCPDGNSMISTSGVNPTLPQDNNLYLWDIPSGKVTCRLSGHNASLISGIVDRTSGHIYTSDKSGINKVWDRNSCKEIATMIAFNSEDLIIYTPDNYYMSSTKALENVSLKLENKLYSFEQFDLKLNRPDIICERLEKSSKNIIKAYRSFYEKRLKKSGFKLEDIRVRVSPPKIYVDANQIPVTTPLDAITFPVRIEDGVYNIDRLIVVVNGVPIFGSKGIDLTIYNSQSIEHDVAVNLVKGYNKIQLYAYNENGEKSYYETIRIVSSFDAVKGDLYVISIGVDKFIQSDFNLQYAAKDARDILNKMSLKEGQYNKVMPKLLINEDVTKENILGIKSMLSQAKPNDVVVIFIAGHGLLDENLDYFFATYDIDFNDPSKLGVSYGMLEALLEECKAYSKLLLMDTCHSGELDKDEVEKAKNADTKIGDVTFRAVGVSVVLKEGIGLEDTGLLLEKVFTSVESVTGATVISSAGGAEYAIESKEKSNGLFTYAVLEFLDEEVDINGLGTVSELRDYVYKKVVEKSNNAQRPTARSENISNDFRIR
ncbi:MAG: WD40 repeat protein [Flavobacteriales bacterium]